MQQPKYLTLYNEFIVDDEHITDKGILTACKILGEITRLYDQTIIAGFGDLNYHKTNTSSYHIDLIDTAHKGDVIRLETEATVHPGLSIDLNVIVNNLSQKNRTLAIGHFVFNRISDRLKQTVPSHRFQKNKNNYSII